MSIKPVACADNGVLNWYADSKTAEKVDLYAIPDTHRVVSVELLHDIETDLIMEITNIGRLQAIRAIIEEKP